MFLNDDIPDLKIQRTAGKTIILEQSDGQEGQRIEVHPIHVRYIAEQFGLVPSGDLLTAQALSAAARRIELLRDRARSLREWLADPAAQERTGPGYGVACAEALATLAAEFCEQHAE